MSHLLSQQKKITATVRICFELDEINSHALRIDGKKKIYRIESLKVDVGCQALKVLLNDGLHKEGVKIFKEVRILRTYYASTLN